jgi:hypothetical protein
VLAARGEAERAREEAQRAWGLAREHGYALFEPRAAALLVAQPGAEAELSPRRSCERAAADCRVLALSRTLSLATSQSER